MCFGKGLSRNEPENCKYPNPNNFCGGFALNAVLTALEKDTSPMCVYTQIQEYQKTILQGNLDTKTFQYLISTQTNGTFMSLPSGICAAFKNYVTDRTVTVCYSSNFAESDFKALIIEERARITALGMTVNPDDDLSKIDWSYILVLVEGCHWIAVKRIEEGEKFICYDPGKGKNSEGDTMEKAIENLEEEYEISGLYICIPKTI